jgi:Tol biopolymer transport system component
MRMTRRAVVVGAVALTSIGALAGAGAAHATFPGTNGPIVYLASGGQLFMVDPTISPPVTQQITTAGAFQSANFDATGTHLVAETNAAWLDGIVFLDPKPGSTVTPLAGGNTADRSPSFDPTGTKVTFSNGGDIFVQNVDGTGRTNLTSAFANSLAEPDWSPDGQFIAFQDNTDFQIKKINVADGTITTLTPAAAGCTSVVNGCFDPSYSGDGQHVAYGKDGANQGIYDVLSSGAATAVTRLSTGDDDTPAYAPDGTAVVFQGPPPFKMTTVPTSGTMARTQIGEIVAGRLSWGVKPAEPPAGPPPSNEFSFGALSRNTKKGTAVQTITVPGSGELLLGGKGVVAYRAVAGRASKQFVTTGDVPVTIEATGKAAKKLKKKGKAKVTATFTFTPDGGTTSTQTKKIKLKRKRKK